MYAHCLAVRIMSRGVEGLMSVPLAPFLFVLALAALAVDLLVIVWARTSPTMPRPAHVTAALRMTPPCPGADEAGADAEENETEPEPVLGVNRVAPRLPGPPPPMGNLPPAARTTPEMPLIVRKKRGWLCLSSSGGELVQKAKELVVESSLLVTLLKDLKAKLRKGGG